MRPGRPEDWTRSAGTRRFVRALALLLLLAAQALPMTTRASVAVTVGDLPCADRDQIAERLRLAVSQVAAPGDDVRVYAAAAGPGQLALAFANNGLQQQRLLRFGAEDCPELAQAIGYLVESWLRSNVRQLGAEGHEPAPPAPSLAPPVDPSPSRRVPLVGRWRAERIEQLSRPLLRLQFAGGAFTDNDGKAAPALRGGLEWDASERFGLGLRAGWDAPVRSSLSPGTIDASLLTLELVGRYGLRTGGNARIDLLAGAGLGRLAAHTENFRRSGDTAVVDAAFEVGARWRLGLTRSLSASAGLGLQIRRVADRLVVTEADGTFGAVRVAPVRLILSLGLDWTAFWEEPRARDIQW